MPRTCDRLVRCGLIDRLADPRDRRAVSLVLTQSGRDLVGDVVRRRADEIRALVGRAVAEDTPEPLALRAVVAAVGGPTEAEWWGRWSAAGRFGSPYCDTV